MNPAWGVGRPLLIEGRLLVEHPETSGPSGRGVLRSSSFLLVSWFAVRATSANGTSARAVIRRPRAGVEVDLLPVCGKAR